MEPGGAFGGLWGGPGLGPSVFDDLGRRFGDILESIFGILDEKCAPKSKFLENFTNPSKKQTTFIDFLGNCEGKSAYVSSNNAIFQNDIFSTEKIKKYRRPYLKKG